jgi:hypothetical protein
MGIISAQTTFTISASSHYTEEESLILLPENDGANVLRELHYPNNVLLPLVYAQNPDKYENFDSYPLTARPIVQSDQTIGGNTIARWLGYIGDSPVIERWQGDETKSHMYLYFLRRLWEYFANPPQTGYITWYPKDRTTAVYNIEIENLTAGGQQITLDYLAARGQFVMGEIAFSFRIIGEV